MDKDRGAADLVEEYTDQITSSAHDDSGQKPKHDVHPKSAHADGSDSGPEIKLEVIAQTPAPPSAAALEALILFRTQLLRMIGGKQQGTYLSNQSTARAFFRFVRNEKLSPSTLMAKYISLWSVLEAAENHKYLTQAFIGLKLLESDNLKASADVYRYINFQTSPQNALSYVMRGVKDFMTGLMILLGALAAVYLTLGILSPVLMERLRFDSFAAVGGLPPETGMVAAAVLMGMLGSVVSILLRIGEFESIKGRSQMFLRLTGSTLPIVGGMFAAFISALICSKIINIPIGEAGLNAWMFIVIGFLSGFSERFSRSFIQLAEKRLGGGDTPEPSSVKLSTQATVAASHP